MPIDHRSPVRGTTQRRGLFASRLLVVVQLVALAFATFRRPRRQAG
ncbi:MAG: hypothetical protein AVDCRST_MAG33-382 [uncultured Thermomicrobiales bacterium]|uniref:Uncharacterized protein n=1 Tax=uncultured Thermomicrobiales bacterium TaxID=1645740 RepID=A0A6J4UBT7_9BACT|nr:MAG: hypothetical protein AVDCRST_MAG33-382 [uncultured Thermomicrobiales bacterium]